MQADVIVIGAGAAGLLAALELSEEGKKVLVLEARHRAGGRIHTITGEGFEQPIEGGAEFVHGPLPLTHQLLKKASLHTVPAEGSIWRSAEGKLKKEEDFIAEYDALLQALKSLREDVSVAQFLQTHFPSAKHEALRKTLKSYVEGYYAGDLQRASAIALREELEGAEDADARITGGYGQLVHYLQQQCEKRGCHFYFNTAVNSIHWQKGSANVAVESGEVHKAAQVIVTVPVGVLQQGGIAFKPALAAKMAAVQQLGFGGVIKMVLQFKQSFWQQQFALNDMAFLFSEESIPTWWTQHPTQSNVLTGWCAGPAAHKLKEESNEALFEKGVTSIANCFAKTAGEIKQQITAWKVFNWVADNFTQGGYSYLTVQSKEAITALATPVEGTIYFAGEGLQNSMEIGTVEAALQSGRMAAQQVLANR